MKPQITVKCSLCGDEWDTEQKVGEGEVCTACEDVFIIQESDVIGVVKFMQRREER